MTKNILFLDLETSSPNVLDAEIKVFGGLDLDSQEYFIWHWDDYHMAKVVKLLLEYDTVVTFNGTNYDIPLLEKEGIPIRARHIDLIKVVRNIRNELLNKNFTSYSLKNIVSTLGLDENGKGEIDYNIFKKNSWNPTEQLEIVKYLKQDLLLTYKLWNYLDKRFENFKSVLSDTDNARYKYITATEDTYTYKALCHLAGSREYYDEKSKIKIIPKSYIGRPRKEKLCGPISIIHLENIYSATIAQFNLLSSKCECCNDKMDGKFHGKNFFTVKGYYCQKTLGKIEKVLGDINSATDIDSEVSRIINKKVFSVMCNPKYFLLYNATAVIDCVHLIKQQLKYISERLSEKGYFVVFVDTDNIFVYLDATKGKSEKSLEKDVNDVLLYLHTKIPFPNKVFGIKFVHGIKWLQFHAEDNTPFPLNHEYLYVTNDSKINAKNLDKNTISKMLEGQPWTH